MRELPAAARARLPVLCALALFLGILPAVTPRLAAHARGGATDADRGRQMFAGQVRMRNGGPPCASCHAFASLGFPNGGALGPDLSGIYDMLGPEGTEAALQTLYFPTMMPLYEKRPLTTDEQRALEAFFRQSGTPSPARNDTPWLAALAVAGFLVLMGLTWLAWRNRLGGVRASLVRRAQAGGART